MREVLGWFAASLVLSAVILLALTFVAGLSLGFSGARTLTKARSGWASARRRTIGWRDVSTEARTGLRLIRGGEG